MFNIMLNNKPALNILQQLQLFILMAVPPSSASSLSVPLVEMNALHELHTSTGGEYWFWRPNESESGARWDFTKNASSGEYLYNPCGSDVNLEWQGITCSSSPSITIIDLHTFNLTGSVPESIGQLSNLTSLEMYENLQLTGSLPSSLGELQNLKYFDSAICAITGTLPMTLSKLTGLEQLWMSENSLSGSIPPELGELTQLQFMNFAENHLTGSLPSVLGKMTDMILLGFDYNMLSGTIPPELGRLTQMEILGISNCGLTGSIPVEIANFERVEFFYIQSNELTGTIPPELGQYTNVKYFYLSNNILSGTIPVELGQMSLVVDLYMDDNKLTGTVPSELFQQFHALEIMRFQRNQLTGNLNGRFGGFLSVVENVDFSDNRLSGSIPRDLFMLPSVLTIALTLNCFGGTLPQSMCAARNLTVLSLDGLGAAEQCKHAVKVPLTGVVLDNTLTGTIPECVWTLPRLQVLHMTGNGEVLDADNTTDIIAFTTGK
jgi:Leucine-rich repeat (LRR) protein